jgi:hypothetical protein
MVSLEFHDPSGAVEVMLPRLKALLEADFAGIEVLPIDAFPQGNAVIGSEETAALVKASGVDAVIVGNAA